MSNFFFESLALIGALLQDEYGNSYLNENPWEDPIFQEFMEASKYDLESKEETSNN